MLGAIGLSLALPIITFILNQFVILFLDLANVSFAFTEMPNFVDEDAKEHILAGIIFSIIDAPFVSHNPVLSIVLNALNLLFFYVIGYFITSGFYRFNWMVGFGYIVMSLGLIALRALLWGSETMELLYNWLPIGEIQLSTVGFMFASIILSVFIMVLIRLTTKRVTIRM